MISRKIKANWGLAYCILTAIVMLVVASFGGRLHRHFPIFFEATRDLFSGVNPYGKAYDNTGIQSYYHYAPFSTFVFRPFTFLPIHWAYFGYMGTSLLVFFSGLTKLARLVSPKRPRGTLSLFYLILASEVIGSTFGAKIEVVTCGVLFWSMYFLSGGTNVVMSGFLMSIASLWKLQPLPIFGLVFLAIILSRDWKTLWRMTTGAALGTAVSFLTPYLFFPFAFTTELYHTWLSVLDGVWKTTWQMYQSLFTLSYQLVGWPNTADQVQALALLVPILFIGLLYLGLSTDKNRNYLLAFALGSAFIPVFSPMSQGMAYILGTGMLLACCVERISENSYFSRKTWTIFLLAHWYFTSLNFSDVVPEPMRISHLTVRPIGFCVLTVLLLTSWRRSALSART